MPLISNVINQWLLNSRNGKAIAGEIIRDASASIPFTQGQRDVWAGIANETGLAKESLKASLLKKK